LGDLLRDTKDIVDLDVMGRHMPKVSPSDIKKPTKKYLAEVQLLVPQNALSAYCFNP
jgi:hypothetical protein